MDCEFEIDDRVNTPSGTGTVVDKEEIGGRWVLKVDIDDGGIMAVPCSQATAAE